MKVSVVDYHTAGEPFRIALDGVPEIPGATILERRAFAQSSPAVDAVRQLLVNEPRGHADMYGGFLVPPDDDGADLGVLFWHKDGYSTAIGRELKWILDATPWAEHPSDPRLNGIYGTILYDDLGQSARGPHQRNVAVFADGEVDRSPCGSGTSARAALLAADGRLAIGQTLRHDSIVGTTFLARVVEHVEAESRPAVITEVEGTAYETATATFTLDPQDPLGTGFTLR